MCNIKNHFYPLDLLTKSHEAQLKQIEYIYRKLSQISAALNCES